MKTEAAEAQMFVFLVDKAPKILRPGSPGIAFVRSLELSTSSLSHRVSY